MSVTERRRRLQKINTLLTYYTVHLAATLSACSALTAKSPPTALQGSAPCTPTSVAVDERQHGSLLGGIAKPTQRHDIQRRDILFCGHDDDRERGVKQERVAGVREEIRTKLGATTHAVPLIV